MTERKQVAAELIARVRERDKGSRDKGTEVSR